ncbi:ATP-binding protein [Streptomyces mexicanus]|jgi:DNA replication protein DnaC|uniref:ATP-binding protein n=1 Tax=Streptomyces mexicanus TaxID=178566 RepID=A0A7X1LR70_9ACTN|nr:ATP-binding protein [Streptomyces mexicanus]MBC2866364.1 ATP-binding protein [Streptomyces mexicanus]
MGRRALELPGVGAAAQPPDLPDRRRGISHRALHTAELTRLIAGYGCVDLLCLDESGYLDLDKAGAKLLFQIFTERQERQAIAIASNAPFSEWKQTFTDPRLCTAIVHRVTFNAHIVETGTQSYRFAQTQKKPRR